METIINGKEDRSRSRTVRMLYVLILPLPSGGRKEPAISLIRSLRLSVAIYLVFADAKYGNFFNMAKPLPTKSESFYGCGGLCCIQIVNRVFIYGNIASEMPEMTVTPFDASSVDGRMSVNQVSLT